MISGVQKNTELHKKLSVVPGISWIMILKPRKRICAKNPDFDSRKNY